MESWAEKFCGDTNVMPDAACRIAQDAVDCTDDKYKALVGLGFCIGAFEGMVDDPAAIRATLNYLESRYGVPSR